MQCDPLCSNSSLDSGETCDDGNTNSSDGCSDKCSIEPGYECTMPGFPCNLICSNGFIDGLEECDDAD